MVSDFVFPEDEGTGAYSSGEGDDDDAANFAWWADLLGISEGALSGLDLTYDENDPSVDVSEGKALISDSAATATQTGATRDGVLYGVGCSGRTAVPLVDSTVNNVYLSIDLSTPDSPDIETFEEGQGTPTGPHVLIGKANTTDDYAYPVQRGFNIVTWQVNDTLRVSGAPRTSYRIQQALDTLDSRGGGRLEIGPGQWTVYATIDITNEIEIQGRGLETELTLWPGVNGNMFQLADGNDWTELSGMLLDGNSANNLSGHGILIGENCYATRWENLVIQNFVGDGWRGTGSATNPSLEPTLINVYSQFNGNSGFNMTGIGDVSAFNIYAEGNDEHGILDVEGFNSYFHPHGYNNTWNGMALFGDRVQVIGGHMETNQRRGIQNKGDYNTIVGTLFYKNSQESNNTYDHIQNDAATKTHISSVVGLDDADPGTTRNLFTDVNNAQQTYVTAYIGDGPQYTSIPSLSNQGAGTTINGWGYEDLGTSPTSAPTGEFPVGTQVWNENADNDEMWVRVADGSWKQVV